jgi:hypothetical protein
MANAAWVAMTTLGMAVVAQQWPCWNGGEGGDGRGGTGGELCTP